MHGTMTNPVSSILEDWSCMAAEITSVCDELIIAGPRIALLYSARIVLYCALNALIAQYPMIALVMSVR